MLKFRAVAEKMAKNFRGYFFAAHCSVYKPGVCTKLLNTLRLEVFNNFGLLKSI